jgi:hypothetical protein
MKNSITLIISERPLQILGRIGIRAHTLAIATLIRFFNSIFDYAPPDKIRPGTPPDLYVSISSRNITNMHASTLAVPLSLVALSHFLDTSSLVSLYRLTLFSGHTLGSANETTAAYL